VVVKKRSPPDLLDSRASAIHKLNQTKPTQLKPNFIF